MRRLDERHVMAIAAHDSARTPIVVSATVQGWSRHPSSQGSIGSTRDTFANRAMHAMIR